jgi:hypothetical protein
VFLLKMLCHSFIKMVCFLFFYSNLAAQINVRGNSKKVRALFKCGNNVDVRTVK